MQSSRLLSRVLFRPATRNSSSKVNFDIPAMNELPQPKGDWKTNYDALNRRYTLHLLLGIGTLTGTLIFGKAAGYLELYNDIPEVPADIKSYKL
ncbi:uncharacterized protein LOC123315454 [Coccinella septempunctata]|uniref:uncharacterized protein LOC123315454 n=1 Tax=Coccinella septempunctata TaxID=41139 RepID=UPI001D085AD2|nr:uncharacterized protein LOC123315454 [Coccinella septempunctata]